MAKERIPIKKIDNLAARQVTFSKRRRGLFKKAEELSILCDADVALIIHCTSTGKIFEYSSSSMKEILERHKLHSKNLEKSQEQTSVNLTRIGETGTISHADKQMMERRRQQRQTKGEELQSRIEKLLQLEKSLESGRHRVVKKKEEKMRNEISSLKERGMELIAENLRLKHQVMKLSGNEQRQQQCDSENLIYNEVEGQTSVSVTDAGNSSSDPSADHGYSSDTSLRLGLPYSN